VALIKNKLINIENLGVKIDKNNKKLNDGYSEKSEPLYIELAKIVKQFPEKTPAEILYSVDDVPAFMGDYDTTIHILNIKIDDAIKRLEVASYMQDRNSIQTEINNWKYVIEKLEKNREEFENANTMYEEYKKKHSGVIEIIFSQEVKNEIVRFNVFLSNAFGMAGHPFEEDIVREIKDRFIFAMRKDMGTL